MTLPVTNRNDYIGNGNVDTYAYGYKIFAATDLLVTVRDTDGVETTLVYPTHYSVSGVGLAAGGNVALVNGGYAWLDADGDLKNLYALSIRRVRPLTQTTDLRNQAGFFAEVHEDTFDHLMMVDQQQQDELDRSIKIAESDVGSGYNLEIPTETLRANKVLGFDADGDIAVYSASSAVTDAGSVNFLQAGAGAVSRTVQDKERDIVSAKDFGFLTTATAAVNKAAIVAAVTYLATLAGGSVFLPRGAYNCVGDIAPGVDCVQIEGAGPAATYGEVTAPTQLNFTSGTVGFDLTFIDAGGAGSYNSLRNLGIDGASTVTIGVKVDGMVLLENIQVSSCTAAGIQLQGATNSTRLKNVCAVANTGGTGYGIFVKHTSGNNTAFSFEGVVSRQNTVGLRIENALHATFKDCVLESNTNEGLYIYKPTGGNLGWLKFISCWIESNNVGTSNYQVVLESQTHDIAAGPAGYIDFDQCMINGTGTVRHMSIVAGIAIRTNRCVFNGGDQTNSLVWGAFSYKCSDYDRINGGVVDGGTLNYECVEQATEVSTGEPGGPKFETVFTGRLYNTVSHGAAFQWAGWNPSDLIGTITSAGSGGTATDISNLITSVNSSGTVTTTLSRAGRYRFTLNSIGSHSQTYTSARYTFVTGGTATRLNSGIDTIQFSGIAAEDVNHFASRSFLVTATAGQTVTVLPKQELAGAGAVGDHVAYADMTIEYLGG